ncbi:hypothetical protein HAX54_018470 [Datura stramonium]|uniref:Uncharacterized protein n=1 Tax=Datura stramonium TaxID=4076 RepID=A0ABS8UMH6_DATST|nr:hypothetical protein [Datura stramonium]
MSRCFPYPPPGYSLNRTNNEALIESIKLQKEREIAKAEKKDKKREKKEKRKEEKAAKKEKSELGFDKAIHESKGRYLFKCLEDEAEQLERSNLTEEHGHAVCSQNSSCSSDSTQNSNKRKRPASPSHVGIQAHGSIIRIRLSKKSVQGETSASREKHLPKPAQQEAEVIVRTTALRANPLSKTTNNRSCPPLLSVSEPSTSTPRCIDRVAVDNATPSCSKVHENSIELQYKNLIENWLPPSLQSDNLDIEDDQAWLFQRKPKRTHAEEKNVCSNDTTCGSSTLWPRAQYIHEADLNKKLENFPVSARNIDVAIDFLLIFLNADVSNHVIDGNWLNEVMEKVGAIAGDVLYVIQKLLPRSINKDDTSKINICSIQILEKTKDLMAQVETYYKSLKFSTTSQYPTVGGLSFLDSLLRKLNEMSKSKSGLDFLMKPHIGNLEKELSSLTSILEKELSSLSPIFRDEHETLKDFRRRIMNLAYEVEVGIDSILAQYNAFWHIFCSLPTILKEIKHINAEVTEMWSADVAPKPCYVVAPSKHLPTQYRNPVNDEEIVGFGNDTEKLIQYLVRGTNGLDVIPIVGMGGQGKTTIARKLYNNDLMFSHFDVRAWCIISQTYNRRELLQEIFSQVTGSKDEGDKDDILADKLRKSLVGKRYLIVLDDMWDLKAWDDLRLSFPSDEIGSRIIVTTRLEEVANQVKHHTYPYSLPFLKPDESLKLLQKKVFQQESCPPELQIVSQAVAKRCKGLPLVVVLVAGIIKRKKMEASWWYEVKNSLLSSLGESEGYSLSTMQLSYDNLPNYLKPCLLYMSMFSEDARIPVSKLISLWIAEGFVQNIEFGRLEETAEGYLMDLIHSNVVMVSRRRYNGKVKYCQVHDVVLYFCLQKSREEKFMIAVKGHDSQFQTSDWKESRVSISFSNEHSKFAALGSKTRKPFRQQLRSLITTNEGQTYSWNPFHKCSKLRLLKVLDLSSHAVKALWLATLKPLIHLKYLAVSTDKFHFHQESHLPRLETLIVKCTSYLMCVLES